MTENCFDIESSVFVSLSIYLIMYNDKKDDSSSAVLG